MKATIDRKGALRITPESELESYALKKWVDGYMPDATGGCDSALLVETIVVQAAPQPEAGG